jgi:hypothetical protein
MTTFKVLHPIDRDGVTYGPPRYFPHSLPEDRRPIPEIELEDDDPAIPQLAEAGFIVRADSFAAAAARVVEAQQEFKAVLLASPPGQFVERAAIWLASKLPAGKTH